MSSTESGIKPTNIVDELKSSYLDYSMSVIVSRALPDVRDGLKPVHRACLFAMNQLGITFGGKTVKSARVVGEVIGKYHPHGDTAAYDTIVRMAQDFSLRYCLVAGQGNFGTVDGDKAAAMRYTEVKLQRITDELMADLKEDTVDWMPNYDSSLMMPTVFPTKIPNLLVNGSSGIAVGMATNIPTHNLREVIDGCLAFIKKPDITVDELMTYIPGPDFPTGAEIHGRAGIVSAYRTGRGTITIRSKTHVENDEGHQIIVVTEIPYGVNKAEMVKHISELVRDGKITGINSIKDVSAKDIRIEIELKKDENPDFVLTNLFKQTELQSNFSCNMVALDHGAPKTFNLREMIAAFVSHRQEVVSRRTAYRLKAARAKAHILDGLLVAIDNIDEIIAIIKREGQTKEGAKADILSRPWDLHFAKALLDECGEACRPFGLPANLGYVNGKYYLSPEQVDKILDLRLHQLTGMERDSLAKDYRAQYAIVAECLHILNDPEYLMQVISKELVEVKDKFGDERRTTILNSSADIEIEDLVPDMDVVITLSHEGYVKYQPLSDYDAQHRGGQGKSATKLKDNDYIVNMAVANTHDYLIMFTSKGREFLLKVFNLPEASRGSKGRPLVNVVKLGDGERVTQMLPVHDFGDEGEFKKGRVKKLPLRLLSSRSLGKIVITLLEGDDLIGVAPSTGNDDIMLFSKKGRCIRFNEYYSAVGEEDDLASEADSDSDDTPAPETSEGSLDDAAQADNADAETDASAAGGGLRPQGCSSRGVRGMKLAGDDDELVALVVPRSADPVLDITETGLGKRTPIESYPLRSNRGGMGVISHKITDKTGLVVGAIQAASDDEILIITDHGRLIRTKVGEVRECQRNSAGVKVARFPDDEKIMSIERVVPGDESNAEEQHPDADVSDDETAALPDVSGDAADGSAPDETDGQ
jgi:DNA gyrase subunit A